MSVISAAVGHRTARLIQTVPYYVPALALTVLMVALTSAQNPGFLSGGWQLVLLYSSPLVVLAMAQAPVLMSGGGGLDLSIGPAAGLVAVLLSGYLMPMGLDSLPVIILMALGMGLLNGIVNGVLAAILRVPPIIATLATYLVYGGLATYLLPAPVGFIPDSMAWFESTTGPVPNVTLVVLVLGLLWMLLCRTAFGRHLRATGSNDRAAYTAGVNVTPVRFAAYVISGLGAGLGGTMLIVVLGGADATVGPGYTLNAIAAAALGGVSLLGGRGGMLGAAVGALLIYLVQNFLTYMAVSTFVLQMVFGLVLVAAIVLNGGWDRFRLGGTR
ncbi:ABC transporter permease [Sphaerisporangium sp. NPDC051011]|uniref:ABC transporter permease n=1 Tax=Sphaerisporangium sp. NPDC051011 TaxID=3155792 RepID=UPI0033E0188D